MSLPQPPHKTRGGAIEVALRRGQLPHAPFIVAEIGSNHAGAVARALRLIDVAAEAGCSAAKFQWTSPKSWLTPADWEKRRPWQVDLDFLTACAEHAVACGLEFMCTPFDPAQVPQLDPLLKRWKIASPNARHSALLDACAATGKPIILSDGYLTYREVVKAFRKHLVLRCVPQYPAPAEAYRIHQWLFSAGMGTRWWPWGVSDHTTGVAVAVYAVVVGALVVEKHIALDDQPETPDSGPHALRPAALRQYVVACQEAFSLRAGHKLLPEPVPHQPGRVVW